MSSPGRSSNRTDPTMITLEDVSRETKPNIQVAAVANIPPLHSTINVNPKNSSSSPPPPLDHQKLTSSYHLSSPPSSITGISTSTMAPPPPPPSCAADIHDEDQYFNSFPPGFRFVPFDHELVVDYLTRKVKGQSLPRNRISDVTLYKYNPEDLAAKYKTYGEKEWYFFTPRDRKYKNGRRPNRSAGNGYWKATGADKNIITKKGGLVGYRKALVFYTGKAPKGEKTNWIMHEFRVSDKPNYQIRNSRDDMRLDDWVLCRIYKKTDKPSAKNRSAAENDHDDPDDLPMDDSAGECYNADEALGDQLSFVFDHHDLCPPQQHNAYTGFSDPSFCTGFSAPAHEIFQDIQAPSFSETYDFPLPVPPHSNNWIKLPPRGGEFPDEIWIPESFSHHQVPNFHEPSFFSRHPSFQGNSHFHSIPFNVQQPLPAPMRAPMPMNCPSNPPILPIRQWPMNFPSNPLPPTTTNNQPITRLPAPFTRPGNIPPPSNLPAPINPASSNPSTSAVDVVAQLRKKQSPHADD